MRLDKGMLRWCENKWRHLLHLYTIVGKQEAVKATPFLQGT